MQGDTIMLPRIALLSNANLQDVQTGQPRNEVADYDGHPILDEAPQIP
jgi:hypothetical protein